MPLPQILADDHHTIKIGDYSISTYVERNNGDEAANNPIQKIQITLTRQSPDSPPIDMQVRRDTQALQNLIETRLNHEGFVFDLPRAKVTNGHGIINIEPDRAVDTQHLPNNPTGEIIEILQKLYIDDKKQDLRKETPTLEMLAKDMHKSLTPPIRERVLTRSEVKIASHNPFSLDSLPPTISHILKQSDLAMPNGDTPAYCPDPEKQIPRITKMIVRQVYKDGNCRDKNSRELVRPPKLSHTQLKNSVREGLDIALIAEGLTHVPQESRDKIVDHFSRQQYLMMREERGLER